MQLQFLNNFQRLCSYQKSHFSGNRRPRKNYSKFPSEEINQPETLDNDHVYAKNEISCTETDQQKGMDNDSAFSEYEIENRQDFSDDSDYGKLSFETKISKLLRCVC